MKTEGRTEFVDAWLKARGFAARRTTLGKPRRGPLGERLSGAA
jgi:hypothetical protein